MTKKIIHVNPEICTGCRVCESVCSLTHFGRCNPAEARIRVLRWEQKGVDVPVVCLQCDDAICANVCPVNAITRNHLGAMETDKDLCLQCNMCVIACPFGGCQAAPSGEILRCDFCYGDPQCVKLCQTKALEYIRADRAGLKQMKKAVLSRTDIGLKSPVYPTEHQSFGHIEE